VNKKKYRYKEKMQLLVEELIEYTKDNEDADTDNFIVTEEEEATIVTTTIQSTLMNLYPAALIFSYSLGFIYFFASTDIPEGIDILTVYRSINQLNLKFKFSNTSFIIDEENNRIIVKFLDLITNPKDIINILISLSMLIDEELF
jgi:hypothetical protein